MESHWYCSDPCLETGILQRLEKSSQPKDKTPVITYRIRIGLLLLEMGAITKEQLDLAVADQQRDSSQRLKEKDERLGHYLQSMGFIKERDITVALSRQFSLPIINLANQRLNPKTLKMVPPLVMQRLKFLPLEYDATGNSLSLVTSDPSFIPAMINLRGILNCDLSIFLGDETAVRELIQGVVTSAQELGSEMELSPDLSTEDLSELARGIVERARDLQVKSLSVGYFNQLVWTRFSYGSEYIDSVCEYVLAQQDAPVGSPA
ncbi:MAG TPA: hypothetical protein VMW38_18740 [Terriglobia bacterium]|nr:hypothetical protein [Terriglobia bacterium]